MAADERTDVERLAGLMLTSNRCVVFTGVRLGATEETEAAAAGSAWSDTASLEVLLTEPTRFWEHWLPRALQASKRVASPAHHAIVRLEAAGVVTGLITQAVDHLHAKAGSRDVVEVHANVLSCRCTRCKEVYGLAETASLVTGSVDGVPRCTLTECGYPLRPTGTLWGEPLVEAALTRAWDMAAATDLFVLLDVQLRTMPMSLLPSVPLRTGVPVVLVGITPTQYDRYATMMVRRVSPGVIIGVADLIAPGPGEDPAA